MDFERYYLDLFDMLNGCCKKIASGKYDPSDSERLFELSKKGRYPSVLAELAENLKRPKSNLRNTQRNWRKKSKNAAPKNHAPINACPRHVCDSRNHSSLRYGPPRRNFLCYAQPPGFQS
jgi:hypothetical protein